MSSNLPHILVLEDEPDHYNLIKQIFLGSAEVIIAVNSEQFLQAIEHYQSLSLFILDNRIHGDVNYRISEVGYMLLKTIKEDLLIDIPVIFSTAEPLIPEQLDYIRRNTRVYAKPYEDTDDFKELALNLIKEYHERKHVYVSMWFEKPEINFVDSANAILVIHLSTTLQDIVRQTYVGQLTYACEHEIYSLRVEGTYIQSVFDMEFEIPNPIDHKVFIPLSIRTSPHRMRIIDIRFYCGKSFVENISIEVDVSFHEEATYPSIQIVTKPPSPQPLNSPTLTLSWRSFNGKKEGTVIGNRSLSHLSITDKQIEIIHESLLHALKEIERRSDKIPARTIDEALQLIQPLIESGERAFRLIFPPPELRRRIKEILHRAKVVAKYHVPILQIVIEDQEQHFVAWDILYSSLYKSQKASDAINGFWGMGYLIQKTLPGSQVVESSILGSIDQLRIAFLRNGTISSPQIHEVKLFTMLKESVAGLIFRDHQDIKEQSDLEQFLEQHVDILQFVGHGHPNKNFPIDSKLDIGGNFPITPGWLENIKLNGSPLVIINACTSVHLDPSLHGNFVYAFMNCGARGILGTLVPIRARFASRFITKFYENFLSGQNVGEAIRQARWDCWEKAGSILGLLYNYYGNIALQLHHPVIFQSNNFCRACMHEGCLAEVISENNQ